MTRFVVNGVEHTVDSDPSTPLVHVLRHELELRGVRPGCAIGECGSCVVLLDDRPVRSCQTPLSDVEGANLTTPEGLESPVRQAFLDEQAAQCGYCVNGIMMSVAGLMRTNSAPSTTDAREALSEHLCRCGTHHRILRAVDRLVGAPAGEPDPVRRPPKLGSDPDGVPDPPGALRGAPNVEDWLRPLPDGRIEVRSGRVELGQGVRTALGQITAAELGLPVERIVVRSAATDGTPDEGYTAGSASLEQGGSAVARAAAAYRRLCDQGLPPTGPILPDDVPSWSGDPLGTPVHRTDLADKLSGGAYVHDLVLPDMVHARALLPPTYDARPTSLDVDAVRSMPGVQTVVQDGGVLIVLADKEEQAIRAITRLGRMAVWDDPGLVVDPPLRERPSTTHPVLDEPAADGGEDAGRVVNAIYGKPYEAHGSMAPSCAVAKFDDEGYTVWTHAQGVYPLRRELAAMVGEDENRVVVRHLDGPGCYGHNGADDAAGFAVRAARAAPGRPVRFQFSLADELGWEPFGTQMQGELSAMLDDQNALSSWRYVVRTDAHTARPRGSGDGLAPAWLSADGPERPWSGTGEGGVRNAVPIYDVPARHVRAEYARGPLRTSALRTLGAYFNLFAIESFMDELAEAAGTDPVAFRLAHLRDERAREVLRTAVEAVDWHERVGPSGRGLGVAVARYKASKAYVAQAVEVHVDTSTGAIAVSRVVTACDAGGIVNPDGLRNQLEGGTLQGLSRALHEQVRYSSAGVESRDWTSYPVLRFADVPELRTILLDRPGLPPLGAGEASTPVTPAALANAVDDAVGIRVRTLPLTPERLRSRLEELTEAELARVRV